jgi:short chain dehydrogenase
MGAEQKVVLITGASQGIGAALVAAYRDRKYRVVATALSVEPSNDDDILVVSGDIADRKTAERVISEGVNRFGRIDMLVDNAERFCSIGALRPTITGLTGMTIHPSGDADHNFVHGRADDPIPGALRKRRPAAAAFSANLRVKGRNENGLVTSCTAVSNRGAGRVRLSTVRSFKRRSFFEITARSHLTCSKRTSGVQRRSCKMSDWRVLYRDDLDRDRTSRSNPSEEAALVQARLGEAALCSGAGRNLSNRRA